jgi:hypothetical protein
MGSFSNIITPPKQVNSTICTYATQERRLNSANQLHQVLLAICWPMTGFFSHLGMIMVA